MTQQFVTGVSEDMKTVYRLEVMRKIMFSAKNFTHGSGV